MINFVSSAVLTKLLARAVLTPARAPYLVVTISKVPFNFRLGLEDKEYQQHALGSKQFFMEPVLGQ